MPRDLTSRHKYSGARAQLRRALHGAMNRIVVEASALLNNQFKTYRRHPIRAPIEVGGSFALHFLEFHGEHPSARSLDTFISTLKSRGLHAFVDKMERKQTNLRTGHVSVATSVVVTVKWAEEIIKQAQDEEEARERQVRTPYPGEAKL